MGNTDRKLDPELVSRTASVFAMKTRVLDPVSLEMLAGDVLRHVAGRAQAARDAGACTRSDADSPSDGRLAEFCAGLLGPDPGVALRFLEDRQAEGASFDSLCLDYLGAAAAWLGQEWDNSRLSFLDVTVAVGHLYALMRALRDHFARGGMGVEGPRRALFATVPGEEHGLGITLAADMFRADGWEIDLRTGCDHDTLVAEVGRLQPPVIGLSLSSEDRLADLVRLVVAIRLVAPGATIAVAPPASTDDTTLAAVIDVDLVIRDAVAGRSALDRLAGLRA